MEAGREWFVLIWRTPVGSVALMGSLIIHLLLAAWALYDRRSLRMSGGEAFQIVFGFSIPLLLALHFVGTRGTHQMFGTEDNYAYILLAQWKFSANGVYWQTAGLFAAWIHGCIGLYYWLRLRPWFRTVAPGLFAAAILLPVTAWLGYYIAGKEVLSLAENKEWLAEAYRVIQPPDSKEFATVKDVTFWVRVFVVGLIGVALTCRGARTLIERRRSMFSASIPMPGSCGAQTALASWKPVCSTIFRMHRYVAVADDARPAGFALSRERTIYRRPAPKKRGFLNASARRQESVLPVRQSQPEIFLLYRCCRRARHPRMPIVAAPILPDRSAILPSCSRIFVLLRSLKKFALRCGLCTQLVFRPNG